MVIKISYYDKSRIVTVQMFQYETFALVMPGKTCAAV